MRSFRVEMDAHGQSECERDSIKFGFSWKDAGNRIRFSVIKLWFLFAFVFIFISNRNGGRRHCPMRHCCALECNKYRIFHFDGHSDTFTFDRIFFSVGSQTLMTFFGWKMCLSTEKPIETVCVRVIDELQAFCAFTWTDMSPGFTWNRKYVIIAMSTRHHAAMASSDWKHKIRSISNSRHNEWWMVGLRADERI